MVAFRNRIAAAEAGLGTAMTTIDDYRTHAGELMAANNAVDAATMAVDGLTATSTEADVAAAEGAIAAAKAAVAAGTTLTASEVDMLNGDISTAETGLANARTAIADYNTHAGQLMAANSAVDAATMAVAGLTAMSSDADVAAAATAIAAAEAAVAAGMMLTAAEMAALNGKVALAKVALGDARTEIAEHRAAQTHGEQLTAANNAVDAATMAVAGLTDMSSDADVTAAENLIAMAKAAVAAGTMLTAAEVTTLNASISTAETDLRTTETAIADRRTRTGQVMAANDAVDAATMAVDALNAMSSTADADAAQALIDAAEAAVAAGTMLTASETAALNGKIALAKVALEDARTEIAAYQTHQMQYDTAMGAVNAAKMAVDGLTVDSERDDVAAAETAIAAAKTAVDAGTALTPDEVAMLNGSISTAAMDLSDIKGQIALREDRDDARRLARLHGEASGATADTTAARKMADDALANAQKYSGMLGVLDVGGSSVKAASNAQMVLDARTDATTATQNAEAAKARAETAKEEAADLPDGDDKVKLIDALDAAIVVAEAEIERIMAIADAGADEEGSLASYLGTVEGTAADTGMGVANLINTALTTGTTGTPALTTAYADVQTIIDDTVDTTGMVMMGPSDARGETFAELFASMLIDTRIADGTGTRAVKAKSVADMTLGDLFSTVPTAPLTTTDGTQIAGADVSYKGIAGVLFCTGECGVEVADATATTPAAGDKLTGSWYFTDLNANNTYLAGTEAGTYSLESPGDYVRYGYWLTTTAADDDTTTIRRYAVGPDAQTTPAVYSVDTDIDSFSGTSATYRGKALGMSVVKTFDGSGTFSLASGGFTADAILTMKFGTSQTLGGTISNFMGDAVGAWTVKLEESDISSGTVAGITNDDPDGTDMEGAWTATIWGGDGTEGSEARPTGAYGGFTAEFTNGNVAGVYATRKQ